MYLDPTEVPMKIGHKNNIVNILFHFPKYFEGLGVYVNTCLLQDHIFSLRTLHFGCLDHVICWHFI